MVALLQLLIFIELGYDCDNPYINSDDERELNKKPEIEREEELDNRKNIANQKKTIYEAQYNILQKDQAQDTKK